jgi:hypothetical protein
LEQERPLHRINGGIYQQILHPKVCTFIVKLIFDLVPQRQFSSHSTYATPKMLAVEQISYGDPWTSLRVNNITVPEPKDNQVLIKVEAVSVNPLDIWMRNGYGRSLFETQRKLPFVPGRDCSGVIVDIGPSVWNYKVVIIVIIYYCDRACVSQK